MKFKIDDWVEVKVDCLPKEIKGGFVSVPGTKKNIWGIGMFTFKGMSKEKIGKIDSQLPDIPAFVGKIRKILKAQRPYGVEFFGYYNDNRTDYKTGRLDEPWNHHGLFWFKEVELKKVGKRRKARLMKKMIAWKL